MMSLASVPEGLLMLSDVAVGRGRPADGARIAGRMLTAGVRAVALVQRAGIGVRRAGRPGRLLGVGRARGARARAGLNGVALARGLAAHRARGRHRVLAVDARAVALVEGAEVAVVGTCRPIRLPGAGVRGTRSARAGAGLREITLPSGRSTDGARVAHQVLAGGAGAVALVQGAGITVVR